MCGLHKNEYSESINLSKPPNCHSEKVPNIIRTFTWPFGTNRERHPGPLFSYVVGLWPTLKTQYDSKLQILAF